MQQHPKVEEVFLKYFPRTLTPCIKFRYPIPIKLGILENDDNIMGNRSTSSSDLKPFSPLKRGGDANQPEFRYLSFSSCSRLLSGWLSSFCARAGRIF